MKIAQNDTSFLVERYYRIIALSLGGYIAIKLSRTSGHWTGAET